MTLLLTKQELNRALAQINPMCNIAAYSMLDTIIITQKNFLDVSDMNTLNMVDKPMDK